MRALLTLSGKEVHTLTVWLRLGMGGGGGGGGGRKGDSRIGVLTPCNAILSNLQRFAPTKPGKLATVVIGPSSTSKEAIYSFLLAPNWTSVEAIRVPAGTYDYSWAILIPRLFHLPAERAWEGRGSRDYLLAGRRLCANTNTLTIRTSSLCENANSGILRDRPWVPLTR